MARSVCCGTMRNRLDLDGSSRLSCPTPFQGTLSRKSSAVSLWTTVYLLAWACDHVDVCFARVCMKSDWLTGRRVAAASHTTGGLIPHLI